MQNFPIEHHEFHKQLNQINSDFFVKNPVSDFESYYSYEDAKDLIAKDRAFRGTLTFRDNITNLGLIRSDDFVKRVYSKSFHLNRALHGCEVIFCPVVENWNQYLVINQTEDIKNVAEIEEAELLSEEVAIYNDAKKHKGYKQNLDYIDSTVKGKIQKIFVQIIYIEKNPLQEKPFVVKLRKDQYAGFIAQYLYQHKYPYFSVKFSEKNNKIEINSKSYYLAKYEKWGSQDKFPTISLISNLGEVGQIDTEIRAIFSTFDISVRNHSDKEVALFKEQLGIAKDGVFHIPEDEITRREDLRTSTIFTVSDPKSKELDQAISISKLPEGQEGFEIGVHVVDVSYFVQKDSHFDVEAAKRCNSIYLPNRTYSMLPSILGENLCSLDAGKDKLAFSVFVKVNGQG